ncbi:unnamed protein product [Amoebophrya sp. A120]|nr:unnamed protein product [Amoebophrya sp. A120]|eukprot:GSA120T00009213001.1
MGYRHSLKSSASAADFPWAANNSISSSQDHRGNSVNDQVVARTASSTNADLQIGMNFSAAHPSQGTTSGARTTSTSSFASPSGGNKVSKATTSRSTSSVLPTGAPSGTTKPSGAGTSSTTGRAFCPSQHHSCNSSGQSSASVIPAGHTRSENAQSGQQQHAKKKLRGSYEFLQERVFALSHSRWSPTKHSPELPEFASYSSLLNYLHRSAGIYSSVLKYMLLTTIISIVFFKLDEEFSVITDNFSSMLSANSGNSTPLISIFTGVLSFTLVFRINLAYGRWWQSRCSAEKFAVKLMNCGLQAAVFDQFTIARTTEPRNASRRQDALFDFRAQICALISFAHAEAVKEWGGIVEVENLTEFFLKDFEALKSNNDCRCGVMQAYTWIMMLLTERFCQHAVPSPIIARLNSLLDEAVEAYFDALLIRTTPFPKPFTQIINIGLFLTLFLIPIVIHAALFPNLISIILLNNCSCFGFFALAQVASELEDPFGEDFFDHPLEHWQSDFDLVLLDLVFCRNGFSFQVPEVIAKTTSTFSGPNFSSGGRASSVSFGDDTAGGEDEDHNSLVANPSGTRSSTIGRATSHHAAEELFLGAALDHYTTSSSREQYIINNPLMPPAVPGEQQRSSLPPVMAANAKTTGRDNDVLQGQPINQKQANFNYDYDYPAPTLLKASPAMFTSQVVDERKPQSSVSSSVLHKDANGHRELQQRGQQRVLADNATSEQIEKNPGGLQNTGINNRVQHDFSSFPSEKNERQAAQEPRSASSSEFLPGAAPQTRTQHGCTSVPQAQQREKRQPGRTAEDSTDSPVMTPIGQRQNGTNGSGRNGLFPRSGVAGGPGPSDLQLSQHHSSAYSSHHMRHMSNQIHLDADDADNNVVQINSNTRSSSPASHNFSSNYPPLRLADDDNSAHRGPQETPHRAACGTEDDAVNRNRESAAGYLRVSPSSQQMQMLTTQNQHTNLRPLADHASYLQDGQHQQQPSGLVTRPSDKNFYGSCRTRSEFSAKTGGAQVVDHDSTAMLQMTAPAMGGSGGHGGPQPFLSPFKKSRGEQVEVVHAGGASRGCDSFPSAGERPQAGITTPRLTDPGAAAVPMTSDQAQNPFHRGNSTTMGSGSGSGTGPENKSPERTMRFSQK